MPIGKRINFNEEILKVRYRVFNGAIHINMNSLLKQIADKEKLEYIYNESLYFLSYINKGKEISNNIFKVRVGTDATNIRSNVVNKNSNSPAILDGEVIKNQKMAFDNAHPNRWSEDAYLYYFDNMYSRVYGVGSVEVFAGSKGFGIKTPKSKVKMLIGKFISMGFSRADIKEYVDWVFYNKSKGITISLGFLLSDHCIQEWLNNKKNIDGKKKIISEKFK